MMVDLYVTQVMPLQIPKVAFLSGTFSMLLDVHEVGNHALSEDHRAAPRIWRLLILEFDQDKCLIPAKRTILTILLTLRDEFANFGDGFSLGINILLWY